MAKADADCQDTGKNILVGNMSATFNFADPNVRYQRFLARGRPALKSLIDSLLLYECVVVPTQDFMSLAILVGVLGERAIRDLLLAESLRFVRAKGALAYVGNGGGLRSYAASSKQGRKHAFCAPVDEAVAWALDGLDQKVTDPGFSAAVTQATAEVDSSLLQDEIRHETYMDVLQSPTLRKQFAIRNTDMDNLAGVKARGVRIYGGPNADSHSDDEIDTLLLLADTNLELRLMEVADCDDLSSSNPTGHVLKAKADRVLGEQRAADAFLILRSIARIPDIGEGVLTKQIDVERLLAIKSSRDGEAFRNWFHSHCRADTEEIARAYADVLKHVPRIESLPFRVLRFVMTTAAGAYPAAGLALSLVDSFFLKRWLRGGSAKCFIENLEQTARLSE